MGVAGWCPTAGGCGLDSLSSFCWPPSMGWANTQNQVLDYEVLIMALRAALRSRSANLSTR